MKKVMFVSSCGGHLSELLQFEPLFKKYETMIVTEKTQSTIKLKDKYNLKFVPYNIIRAIYLILKYRPDIIITTGAHTGGIFVTVGKILKKKTIYIESMAKVKELSKTDETSGNNIFDRIKKFFKK